MDAGTETGGAISKGSDDDWGTGAFENRNNGRSEMEPTSLIRMVTWGNEEVEHF